PRNCERPYCNQFTCLRSNYRDTYYLTFPRGDDFDVTMRISLDLRAVIIVIRPTRNTNLHSSRSRLRFGQAALCKLRIGIGRPWNRTAIHAHRQAKQRISNNETCVIIGRVRERLMTRSAIPDRIDSPIARLQPGVGDDSPGVMPHARGLKPKFVDLRLAADSNQQMAARDGSLDARCFDRGRYDAAGAS